MKSKPITIGETSEELVLPHSEVCMHMRVAGKRARVQLLGNRSAQIIIDGKPFSASVLTGEVGIFGSDAEGYYYYPAPEHTLQIKSFHDAHAECSCGKWYYVTPSLRTRAQIEAEFAVHLKNVGACRG